MFARRSPRLRLLALASLAAGFILYGSLYPFRFQTLAGAAGLLDTLAAAWAQPPSGRGDVLANLLLYMPLGYLAAAALARHPAWLRLTLPALAGALLSLVIEVAQLYVPGRISSFWDLICNTLGTAMGAALTLFGVARAMNHRHRILEPVSALLVLAWLAYVFFPYLPALDLQVWKDNLKPLLLYPVVEPTRTARLLVTWTAVALMVDAAIGRDPARLAVPVGLAAALAAEVLMPGKRLDLAEAAAIGLTPFSWTLLRGRSWTAPVMAAAMLGAVLVERLEPFVFLAMPRDFGWIPFRSLVHGSMEAGFLAMLFKLFLQGAALWWLLRAGLRPLPAAGLQAALVLGASLLQTYIPGRSAEVTDTLLVLGFAVVFAVVPPTAVGPRAEATWRTRATVRLAHRRAGPARRARREDAEKSRVPSSETA